MEEKEPCELSEEKLDTVSGGMRDREYFDHITLYGIRVETPRDLKRVRNEFQIRERCLGKNVVYRDLEQGGVPYKAACVYESGGIDALFTFLDEYLRN